MGPKRGRSHKKESIRQNVADVSKNFDNGRAVLSQYQLNWTSSKTKMDSMVTVAKELVLGLVPRGLG